MVFNLEINYKLHQKLNSGIMENEFKLNDQLDLLQKQVDQIQLKVFEEKKQKWFKNPSLILSIIAVISSLFFSINSVRDKKQSEIIQKESFTLNTVKESIAKLIEEEEKFMQISSNQYADISTKNSAYASYQSKLSYLMDKISRMINTENINLLEPNLLLNYGRFLYNSGKFQESANIFQKVIELSQDSITNGICFRSLANIYANPSYNKSNPFKSRELRKEDIRIANNLDGERKSDYLSRSFELWAIDEYYFLNNIKDGNRLIDSAKYYAQLFPDLNTNKIVILNRLTEIYNFYNNILVPSQISGEYKFSSSDGKQGNAYISTNTFGSSVNIDFIKNNKLSGRLSGNGNLINIKDIRFDVRIEVVDMFNKSNYNSGSLNLQTQKGKKLTGYLYEFGKEPVKYYLTKTR